MKTAYITAEYNPFHNGHRYHIRRTRELLGAECIVAVMSGNFVQRGEPAVCDKFLRAEAAVRGGADLVVELPVRYAVSNAGRFAAGAIAVMRCFGKAGSVSFGASAGLDELISLRRTLSDPAFTERTADISRQTGKAYPAAADCLLRENGLFREAAILQDPNNVLAVEYLKNMEREPLLTPFAVKRDGGSSHNVMAPSGETASAAYIRERLFPQGRNGTADVDWEAVETLVPGLSAAILRQAYDEGRFPADRRLFAVASFARLTLLDETAFAKIDNVSHGLENRIVRSIRNASSLDEAIGLIKSKRYTMARLRQILTAAALGITKEDAASAPTYIRVLAFNETGRAWLAGVRKTALVPLATNLSDVYNREDCARDAALEYAADKLFDACLPTPQGGNRPFLTHPVYVKRLSDLGDMPSV